VASRLIPLHVIPLTGLDLFASDIETCKHVSASLGSVVIPASERESPSSFVGLNFVFMLCMKLLRNFCLLVALVALLCGCSEKKDASTGLNKQSEETEESKVKKIMETDDFKRLKYYQDKYNDSLNRNNVKDLPRRPGPEGVLKNLMKLCKERGDCPNE
jgi:hypothetical protein